MEIEISWLSSFPNVNILFYHGTWVQTNMGTLLLTTLQNLVFTGFPTNALFLVQGSINVNVLHLALLSFSG